VSRVYRVLVADPPWRFGDKLPGKSRGAEKNYQTLKVADIIAYPIPKMADDSVLLLWRVAAMTAEALQVARAWGFDPKSELVWRKLTSTGKPWFGMGRTVRGAHETCMICTRGKTSSLVRDHSVRSVFDGRVREHSAKPEEFYAIVERLFEGPRAEVFARRKRKGWTQQGLQLGELE
jgi:N6-adenosine-specific RNA methylase IME4